MLAAVGAALDQQPALPGGGPELLGQRVGLRARLRRGVVHTFAIVRRSTNAEFTPDTPYVFAIIALEEGVRMAARVVDVPLEHLRCELPVRVVFPSAGDETPLPCFTGG